MGIIGAWLKTAWRAWPRKFFVEVLASCLTTAAVTFLFSNSFIRPEAPLPVPVPVSVPASDKLAFAIDPVAFGHPVFEMNLPLATARQPPKVAVLQRPVLRAIPLPVPRATALATLDPVDAPAAPEKAARSSWLMAPLALVPSPGEVVDAATFATGRVTGAVADLVKRF